MAYLPIWSDAESAGDAVEFAIEVELSNLEHRVEEMEALRGSHRDLDVLLTKIIAKIKESYPRAKYDFGTAQDDDEAWQLTIYCEEDNSHRIRELVNDLVVKGEHTLVLVCESLQAILDR